MGGKWIIIGFILLLAGGASEGSLIWSTIIMALGAVGIVYGLYLEETFNDFDDL